MIWKAHSAQGRCAGWKIVRAELGLQFGGIDFGIDAFGNVLLYEANATMNVMTPEIHVPLGSIPHRAG